MATTPRPHGLSTTSSAVAGMASPVDHRDAWFLRESDEVVESIETAVFRTPC
jgi:hypothetical protein